MYDMSMCLNFLVPVETTEDMAGLVGGVEGMWGHLIDGSHMERARVGYVHVDGCGTSGSRELRRVGRSGREKTVAGKRRRRAGFRGFWHEAEWRGEMPENSELGLLHPHTPAIGFMTPNEPGWPPLPDQDQALERVKRSGTHITYFLSPWDLHHKKRYMTSTLRLHLIMLPKSPIPALHMIVDTFSLMKGSSYDYVPYTQVVPVSFPHLLHQLILSGGVESIPTLTLNKPSSVLSLLQKREYPWTWTLQEWNDQLALRLLNRGNAIIL